MEQLQAETNGRSFQEGRHGRPSQKRGRTTMKQGVNEQTDRHHTVYLARQHGVFRGQNTFPWACTATFKIWLHHQNASWSDQQNPFKIENSRCITVVQQDTEWHNQCPCYLCQRTNSQRDGWVKNILHSFGWDNRCFSCWTRVLCRFVHQIEIKERFLQLCDVCVWAEQQLKNWRMLWQSLRRMD